MTNDPDIAAPDDESSGTSIAMHDERHGNKINRLISTRFIDQPLAPFIRKLENWIDVSPAETRDLVAATARERSFKSAETLVCAEQERCPVAILRRGIAAAYSLLPNGKRHISSVYFPGDLLTYHNFQTGRAMHEFVMVTSSELVFLNSEKFDRALHEHPHIAQIITLAETARTLFTIDRFAAATRLEAEERVLYLLLELKACMELTTSYPYNDMILSLTQDQISDMLGLTSVYVSKVLSRLNSNGTLRRERQNITFADRSYSELELGFINRYQQVKGWKRPEPQKFSGFYRQ